MAEKTPLKRVNIALPDITHKQAKLISILKGESLNDFLRRAVEEAVNKEKKILKELGK